MRNGKFLKKLYNICQQHTIHDVLLLHMRNRCEKVRAMHSALFLHSKTSVNYKQQPIHVIKENTLEWRPIKSSVTHVNLLYMNYSELNSHMTLKLFQTAQELYVHLRP
jgi:hypothetical protein